MNLPTIVVCDAEPEKKEELKTLIGSQPSLILLGTISRQTAVTQEFQPGIKVLWLELAPNPRQGLKLLESLKERYPKMHYLVSFESLQGDLVKTAMQLGVIEYLDAAGAGELLPPAVERIQAKEESLLSPTVSPPSRLPLSSSLPTETSVDLPTQASHASLMQGRAQDESSSHAPKAGKSAVSPSSLKRTRNLTHEGDPNNPLPPWFLPSVLLIMIIVFVGVMLMNH